MRGETVVVKDVTGTPLVLRVWDADALAVYVTDDNGYERLEKGDPDALPVGFHREAVFVNDAAAASAIRAGHVEWETLSRWDGRQ